MSGWSQRERTFWAAAGVLLAILGVVQVTSVLQETETWDEGIHLAAGYAYLKTGRIGPFMEHPPLRALCALPLLILNPRLPIEHPSWRAGSRVDFATTFLYHNRYHPDTLLIAGRSVTIALTLLFGAVLAFWAKRRFGRGPALFALLLFAFDPNLIAHGRYVATDLLLALTFFLAVIAWGAYLERPGTPTLIWAGVAFGLALISKFSGVLLLPIFALLYLLRRKLAPKDLPLVLGAVAGIALLVVAVAYGPETLRMFSLADHPFVVGLKEQIRHNRLGHESYLLGMCSNTGWWYYFPVVFAVKTPLAVLAATALLIGSAFALGGPKSSVTGFSDPSRPTPDPTRYSRSASGRVACHRIFRSFSGSGCRIATFDCYLLAVPAALYFAASMTSGINLGVRYLLPVYPLLFVLVSAVLFRIRKGLPVVVAALALLEVGESVKIYPHYLAFFNFAAGGPTAGPRYLLDSNIDWGQDVKKLRTYLRAHGIQEVCMSYFGNADLGFYGIRKLDLPRTWETEKRANLDCMAAISVTNLYDLYMRPGSYKWLRELQPTERIGYSIYLYDLRRTRQLRAEIRTAATTRLLPPTAHRPPPTSQQRAYPQPPPRCPPTE